MAKSVRRKGPLIFSVTRFAAKVFLTPLFRVRIDGQENLPRGSAFILLPKHQRWEDIPLLGLATPHPLYYMAKYELFLNPFSRWFLGSLGGIPLNRSRPMESRRSLMTMLELLERGEGIVIFPEGTYYRNRMGPGQVGLIRIILSRHPAPFIPVGMNYSGRGWRTLVRIKFGKPIQEISSTGVEVFLKRIMREIARLSGFPIKRA